MCDNAGYMRMFIEVTRGRCLTKVGPRTATSLNPSGLVPARWRALYRLNHLMLLASVGW